MLELDAGFFAIAAPAVLFAGVSKGGFGSGAAFASSTILALVLEPGQALGVMLPLLMLIDLASLRPYWRRWSWPDARLLLLGGVPGVVLGVALYRVADADVMRLLIGGISVLFVVWQLGQRGGWIHPFRDRLPGWAGLLAGVVTGFTSFVSHAGGPPAAVYLLSQRLDKTRYQASTVLIFWVLNIVKFVPYAWLGMFTWQTAAANLALTPFALIGTWLGVRAHSIVPERVFFGLTYVLLLATGGKLIWDGLV
ncbi:sulfite exporter TauE/SafE family protein [Antarcticimicrobium luteum]|uniref:Probable membrane transporter protein n=1 Tax=Antarcticimicrobium luteum TaxID=2547397 RepID=A0A4R5UT32_9RHOB|nr:sulfite exporter TauE/SafE family protein [Antarcticimicrobium luteum]TDK42290.1 sulfite exporter TauE/SafE family protein [Antarcticimicrobium luteum]